MRSAKELVAGLRPGGVGWAKVRIDTNPSDDGWCFCTPANHPEDVAKGLKEEWEDESQFFGQVIAADRIERTAAPADGLVLETTAEHRELMRRWNANRLAASRDAYEEAVEKLLRDFDKAIAFAASETKRADDWRRVARDDLYNATCRAEKAEAERDREAAARRNAEAIRDEHFREIKRAQSIIDEMKAWRASIYEASVNADWIAVLLSEHPEPDSRSYVAVQIAEQCDRHIASAIIAATERAEQAEAREATLRAALKENEVKAALFDYLAECKSYAYGGDSISEPSPPEFGISWSWQATTPDRPRLLDQLYADAFAFFDRYVNEMDPGDEPTEWDRQVMAHRAALATTSTGEDS